MSSICVAFLSKCPERTEIEPELPRQQGGVLATQNMRRKFLNPENLKELKSNAREEDS